MASAQNAMSDPVEVYTAVLGHVSRVDAAGSPGITPDSRLFIDCMQGGCDGPAPSHPAAILEELQTRLVIRGVVPGAADLRDSQAPAVLVRLGVPLELSDEARVKLLPDDPTPGSSLERQLAAIPDSAAVPADLFVDVVITTPCPAPAGSERCRFPDTLSYRYFLRMGDSGEARVLTRWRTGAI